MRVLLRLLLLPLLAACTRDNQVRISLGNENGQTPIGYRCRDSSLVLLDRRAVDTNTRTMRVSIVTDFVTLGGYPSCRPSDLVTWCSEHPCNAIPQMRSCIELSAPFTLLDNPATVMGQILAQLPGREVTGDAPDQPVIVRVVATAQRCSTITGSTAFDSTLLTGCSFSCPVLLDQVTGDIQLDLPTFTDRCEEGVIACAGGTLR